MSLTIDEGYQPVCIGRVVQLHATYYAVCSGFGVQFEAKLAREMGDFCNSYSAARDGLWLASDSEIQGAIAIDGSGATTEGAHLRWFVTSPALRGQGLGRQLLGRALEFANARKYRHTYLWTFDGLHAARHLYESHGFRLLQEGPGTQWGTEVREQKFVRNLPL